MKSVKYFSIILVLAISSLVFAEDPVHFSDAKLKTIVEAHLGITDPIPTDMLGLTRLSASSDGITDLTGLEHATNLQALSLFYGAVSDISALSEMAGLKQLILHGNQVSDISPLARLANLRALNLDDNQISDISSLSVLTNLRSLQLGHNQICNISALSGLSKLLILDLRFNQISNIVPLSGLTNLQDLHLDSNRISNILSLSELANLLRLYLDFNQISDISPITGLVNLEQLCFYGNQINDISAVSGLTNLYHLELQRNQVSDISSLAGLENLRDLRLASNQLSDISPIVGLKNLTKLFLDHNPLNNEAIVSSIPQIIDNHPHLTVFDYGSFATLALSSTAGGSVSVPGEGSYEYGEGCVASIIATALVNYHFVDWSGNVSIIADTSDPTTSITMTGTYSIQANFAIDQHSLTVTSDRNGLTTGSGIHDWGSTVSITATANADYHFVSWATAGAVTVADASTADTTATINGDGTVTANFAIDQYTVNVNSSAGGSTDRDGSHTINHGDILTITPSPNTGYHFTNWIEDAAGTDNPLTITVTSDMAITANFALSNQAPPADAGEE